MLGGGGNRNPWGLVSRPLLGLEAISGGGAFVEWGVGLIYRRGFKVPLEGVQALPERVVVHFMRGKRCFVSMESL